MSKNRGSRCSRYNSIVVIKRLPRGSLEPAEVPPKDPICNPEPWDIEPCEIRAFKIRFTSQASNTENSCEGMKNRNTYIFLGLAMEKYVERHNSQASRLYVVT